MKPPYCECKAEGCHANPGECRAKAETFGIADATVKENWAGGEAIVHLVPMCQACGEKSVHAVPPEHVAIMYEALLRAMKREP